MNRVVGALLVMAAHATTASAQSMHANTSGLLIGTNFIQVSESADLTSAANGVGLAIGYGVDPNVAIYGEVIRATQDARLTQGDIGIRATGALSDRAWPFFQCALSRRVISDAPVSASALGVTLGLGLSVYMVRQAAVSVGYLTTIGPRGSVEVSGIRVLNNRDRYTMSRLSIGLVFFPQDRR